MRVPQRRREQEAWRRVLDSIVVTRRARSPFAEGTMDDAPGAGDLEPGEVTARPSPAARPGPAGEPGRPLPDLMAIHLADLPLSWPPYDDELPGRLPAEPEGYSPAVMWNGGEPAAPEVPAPGPEGEGDADADTRQAGGKGGGSASGRAGNSRRRRRPVAEPVRPGARGDSGRLPACQPDNAVDDRTRPSPYPPTRPVARGWAATPGAAGPGVASRRGCRGSGGRRRLRATDTGAGRPAGTSGPAARHTRATRTAGTLALHGRRVGLGYGCSLGALIQVFQTVKQHGQTAFDYLALAVPLAHL